MLPYVLAIPYGPRAKIKLKVFKSFKKVFLTKKNTQKTTCKRKKRDISLCYRIHPISENRLLQNNNKSKKE